MSSSDQLERAPTRAFAAWRRWLRRLLATCAFAYPAALLGLSLGFYCVGERWWVTAAGLYAPRVLFAIPLPLLVLVLLATGLRRLLWTQLVAALIAIVPLMGFVMPSPFSVRTDRPTLRVLSFNVNSGYGGSQAITDKILSESPDVVLLQETPWGAELADALRKHYPYVESSTQFIVASRHRIVSSAPAERLLVYGRFRSSRFMRYVIETPVGPIAVYSVHPISPRGVLHVHQFRTALHQLRTGELFAGDPEADMQANTRLRSLQIEAAANAAARESLPVLLAGDTNLPGLSAVFRRNLARFSDGFRAASWGLGYTFPSNHPFLRLDRILASEKLRIISFRVDCQGVSDHLCVVADIQALP